MLKPPLHVTCTFCLEKDMIYTDDTQMTQELAKSLIACKGINHEDLARRFTERYYLDGRNAGYGANVVDVFKKLKAINYSKPLQPAEEQFDGTGSFANGASMRVSPVALFAYPSMERTCKLADETALVTHFHILGRHGAAFQAMAIQKILSEPFKDALMFVDSFKTDLIRFKIDDVYVDQLETIREFLEMDDEPTISTVVRKLGNGVAARRSVPTALFCFLRSSGKDFRSVIEYAITLGGDTDTIASMAGALGGAFFGLDGIRSGTVESCPDIPSTLELADQLFEIAMEKK